MNVGTLWGPGSAGRTHRSRLRDRDGSEKRVRDRCQRVAAAEPGGDAGPDTLEGPVPLIRSVEPDELEADPARPSARRSA